MKRLQKREMRERKMRERDREREKEIERKTMRDEAPEAIELEKL
jgi:hypothetical protein